jgi:serine/threonine protein kinase
LAERLVPFGKYYLLERVNVGGMAEVFKAKTVGVEGFEKLVAIKRILPSVAEDEEFIKMFIDEAKITSQLSHANLAQTFDLGKINDAYYIAMEYVPGKDLRAVQERLKRRGERVPINIATYVIGRVCEGLDYAHRKRDIAGRELHIVHRDVSPQNVIVSFEGEVKLIDFGIAKAANKITSTQAGILKGKFGYMSPEQVRGMPLDRRSDIFAAGVVLYELCTGERLFVGSSDYSVLEKVQQARIVPPSKLVRDIPDRLEEVILKALAREPEQRYQHAADLAQDLMRFLIESHTRIVSRDDIAAFMKAVFPDDDARERRNEAVVLDRTRTGARRVDAPPPEEQRNDQPAQREHFHEPRLREPAAAPSRESEEQRIKTEREQQLRDQQARDQQAKERVRRDQEQREAAARAKETARQNDQRRPVPSPSALHSVPPGSRSQRGMPPKLPSSLIAGIDLAAEGGNELTPRARPQGDREYLSTDPGPPGFSPGQPAASPAPLRPPPLAQQSSRPPPIPITQPSPPPKQAPLFPAAPAQKIAPPALPPLPKPTRRTESTEPEMAPLSPSQVAKWTARDEDEQTEPALLRPPAEDEPTRPMSMKDLAEAERIYVERERELIASNVTLRVDITDPGGPPIMSAPPPKAEPAKRAARVPSREDDDEGKAGEATRPFAPLATEISAPPIAPLVPDSIAPPALSASSEVTPTESVSMIPAAIARAMESAARAQNISVPAPAQIVAVANIGTPIISAPPALAAAASAGPAMPGPEDRPPPAPRPVSVRVPRPSRPPASLPSTLLAGIKVKPTAEITDPSLAPSLAEEHSDEDNTPSARLRRGQPLKAAAPRSGNLAAAPREDRRDEARDVKPAPFGNRMQMGRQTLHAGDPALADETTASGRKAQIVRYAKLAAIAAALAVAAWAWLSVPHKKDELSGPPSGSLTVTTQPEDALVLLDGAQVKGSLDRDYTEPKLAADQEHILIVRREGFTEQTQPISLKPGEQKVLGVQLKPLPGQLTVRSTPSGAQIFLDGQSMGTTPAYLPNVNQDQPHALSLEKHCFRPWQVAIPAHAGKREVAATLEMIFGACPNMKVISEAGAPDLPVGDPKAMASLGFLSLGSRPSASIFIDGVDIGRTTPLVQWPLKVGKHKVRLVLGSKRRDMTVEVRSGQTASEIVDLRKK